jgi:choice-of-anchor B domain-containing protein
MKKFVFYYLACCSLASHAQQQSLNMILLSHWNDTTLNHCDGDQIWNDLTGWKDTVKNREYLIAGSCDSIYFFDITNPTTMIKCDVREGHSRNAINRDYECYSHYVYCVSDRTSPPGSLQIFDLQYLPDSVHLVYDYDTLSINSHTIFIEAKSKRAYLCGNSYKPAGARAMSVLSIDNPEHPYYLGEISSTSDCAYVHETFVQNDTAYCSCGYNGLYIYDVRNASSPVLISSITPPYPYNGYNHSSWIDSSGKYLLFSDEVPNGLPMKLYDIHDIKNPAFMNSFNSHPGATPHNADWKGRFAWVSSYEDGVYCYDLADPSSPKVAGYYDTYMKNAPGVYNGFHGCWGVYCFLPSGNILASDISEGLFVLRPTTQLSTGNTPATQIIQASGFPNPVTGTWHLRITAAENAQAILFIQDMYGKLIVRRTIQLRKGENEETTDAFEQLGSGLYLVYVQTPAGNWSTKVMKE